MKEVSGEAKVSPKSLRKDGRAKTKIKLGMPTSFPLNIPNLVGMAQAGSLYKAKATGRFCLPQQPIGDLHFMPSAEMAQYSLVKTNYKQKNNFLKKITRK